MNEWRISEALKSARQLELLIHQLTADELTQCIKLEEGALRRPTLINRLYREARARARQQFQPK